MSSEDNNYTRSGRKLRLPPLSLYIHLPWCIKKCPYCDFNSHTLKGEVPEQAYIDRLIEDLQQYQKYIQARPIVSIFFGGGTPSLFSPEAIGLILEKIQEHISFSDDIEITMEANPGTVEQSRFKGYRRAGVNRLSLGVQSFQKDKLKTLGRIHDEHEAKQAIETVINSGFDNFNIDLMHCLPNQTVGDALFDLKTAIQYQPTHLSWYQLTIEPNTAFYQQPPTVPEENTLHDIEQQGLQFLSENGYQRYEVSAYHRDNHPCQHNLNYWRFGDYIGIGAGAHGKITHQNTITRFRNVKHPNKYLSNEFDMQLEAKTIPAEELPFEFMLNALRLYEAIPFSLFESRTCLPISSIQKQLNKAKALELIETNDDALQTTKNGKMFYNDLMGLFSS